MFSLLTSLPWKWIGLGILVLSIIAYIGFLRHEVESKNKTIAEQKNIIEVINSKLQTCEGAVSGLQNQNKELIKNNDAAIANFKKINSTLDGVKNVPMNQVKGVVPNEKNQEIINIYNDIFKPFRK